MLAEIVVPHAASPSARRASAYTYAVPKRLAATLEPGQLVTVPFGERILPGVVWSLDASDEAGEQSSDGPDRGSVRALADVLLAEPVVSASQRALAAWLSDYYSASLPSAVRLMLPPGLLRETRAVLLPVNDPSSNGTGGLPADEAIILEMLRERGRLERAEVERALGTRRARAAIEGLLSRGAIALGVELPERFAHARRERRVSLAGAADAVEAWRQAARDRLATLPPAPHRRVRPPAPREEREAERLLRQLAALDVLANDRETGDGSGWRMEELRRMTRITTAALRELVDDGLLAVREAEIRHDPTGGRHPAHTQPLALSNEQRDALAAITSSRSEQTEDMAGERRGSLVFLLHGITGSGKTEVYLQALEAVIARGERGLVLVPEIALTPQAMERYAGRFPGRVALLHSGLTPAERLHEWRRIRHGEVDVVLGSRSALFAPIERLGLIVVDEEHEAAYKQDRTPTYHARDVAARLGAITGATVVLGSATPSVESYALAQRGVYALLELRQRAPVGGSGPYPATRRSALTPAADPTPHPALRSAPGSDGRCPDPWTGQSSRQEVLPGEGEPDERALLCPADEGETHANGLPSVTIVDLRAELRSGNPSIISEPLLTALRETLDRGEQAMLYLNRRGMARGVVCRECGHMALCRRCDIAMTFHGAERRLICHYCGQRESVPQTCPVCSSASIRYFGIGTERIEAAVKRQFPDARVLRWDRDTARTRQAHEELLRAFAERSADVLVGTQMIAKGLDLPGVTLVGVVSADVALLLPDFRAPERAFQLLTQVAGRAGRGDRPGRVLVQTFNPEHFCIQAAARHDYAGFFAAEQSARERYGYPPFRRFVKLTYEHGSRYTAQIEATALAERLERVIQDQALPDTDLVGPAPAFMERLRGRYRWQVLVRSPDPRPVLRALLDEELPFGWSVDVDPTTSL